MLHRIKDPQCSYAIPTRVLRTYLHAMLWSAEVETPMISLYVRLCFIFWWSDVRFHLYLRNFRSTFFDPTTIAALCSGSFQSSSVETHLLWKGDYSDEFGMFSSTMFILHFINARAQRKINFSKSSVGMLQLLIYCRTEPKVYVLHDDNWFHRDHVHVGMSLPRRSNS